MCLCLCRNASLAVLDAARDSSSTVAPWRPRATRHSSRRAASPLAVWTWRRKKQKSHRLRRGFRKSRPHCLHECSTWSRRCTCHRGRHPHQNHRHLHQAHRHLHQAHLRTRTAHTRTARTRTAHTRIARTRTRQAAVERVAGAVARGAAVAAARKDAESSDRTRRSPR